MNFIVKDYKTKKENFKESPEKKTLFFSESFAPNKFEKKNNFKLNFQTEMQYNMLFKKLTNFIMKDGKKTKASKILFKMISILKSRIKKDLDKNYNNYEFDSIDLEKILIKSQLLFLISHAIENIMPSMEVRKVRVAGSTYLVPAILRKKKQETLALKWLLESTKKRQKNSKLDFSTCLADEIVDASRKLGYARQKRDELHRLALQNRAYIRYRWW